MFKQTIIAAVALLAIVATDSVAAQDYQLGQLKIVQPWARATVTQTGGAYVTIDNAGAPDRLLGAQTAIAKAELHQHIMEGNVMKMVPVPGGIALPAGRTTLAPGGYHIMLLGLKAPLKEGSSFPMTLTFEKAGKVEVTVTVAKPGAMGPAGGSMGGGATGGMHDMPNMPKH